MNNTATLLTACAVTAGLNALAQLLFVMTRLPAISWSDLPGGIVAAVITACLLVLLPERLRRSA